MKKIKLEIPEIGRKDGFGWIYFLYLGKEIVYIGQTIQKHPMNRIGQHFGEKQFDSFSIKQIRIELLNEVEMGFIIKHNPKYNKHKRQEKSTEYLTPSEARALFIKTAAAEFANNNLVFRMTDEGLKRLLSRIVAPVYISNNLSKGKGYLISDILQGVEKYTLSSIEYEKRSKERQKRKYKVVTYVNAYGRTKRCREYIDHANHPQQTPQIPA